MLKDILYLLQSNLAVIVLLCGTLMLFLLMYSRSKDATSVADCMDLVTAPNGKYSRVAIGQCFGILVAVWAPVYTTVQDKLDPTVLAISLAYLGGVEAYAKYLRFKAAQGKVDEEPPAPAPVAKGKK